MSTSLNTFCRGTLRRLANTYDVVAVSTPDDELREMAQREGIRVIGVPMRRPIAPLSDIAQHLLPRHVATVGANLRRGCGVDTRR